MRNLVNEQTTKLHKSQQKISIFSFNHYQRLIKRYRMRKIFHLVSIIQFLDYVTICDNAEVWNCHNSKLSDNKSFCWPLLFSHFSAKIETLKSFTVDYEIAHLQLYWVFVNRIQFCTFYIMKCKPSNYIHTYTFICSVVTQSW